MAKAVLWDLDGTLVDSSDHHWQAWRDTLEANGIVITHGDFVSTFGWRNDDILSRWLGSDYRPDTADRIAIDKEERFRLLVRSRGITALPGAAEWIRRLNLEGWRQAIASSAPRANVQEILGSLALAKTFDVLVAAEDVQRGKPDPEVFLKAASLLNVPPSHSIVVEDAATGIEAARRAGMQSIGVTARGSLPASLSVASLLDLPPDAFDRLLAK